MSKEYLVGEREEETVRPRRQTRPPPRLEDYEVQYPGRHLYPAPQTPPRSTPPRARWEEDSDRRHSPPRPDAEEWNSFIEDLQAAKRQYGSSSWLIRSLRGEMQSLIASAQRVGPPPLPAARSTPLRDAGAAWRDTQWEAREQQSAPSTPSSYRPFARISTVPVPRYTPMEGRRSPIQGSRRSSARGLEEASDEDWPNPPSPLLESEISPHSRRRDENRYDTLEELRGCLQEMHIQDSPGCSLRQHRSPQSQRTLSPVPHYRVPFPSPDWSSQHWPMCHRPPSPALPDQVRWPPQSREAAPRRHSSLRQSHPTWGRPTRSLRTHSPPQPVSREMSYRGPKPTIPDFSHKDPSEFARLKMALDNLLPDDATELFRYQVLMDHLKLEEARLVADSYLHSPYPYSDTMAALTEKFGRPHQLALKKIAAVMEAPSVRSGDTVAFERFALQIQSLVGMLQTLGQEGEAELRCGSHVARLLTKLPTEDKANFRRYMYHRPPAIHTLWDLAEWLRYESWCQDYGDDITTESHKLSAATRNREQRSAPKKASILHGANPSPETSTATSPPSSALVDNGKEKFRVQCPYCDSSDHFLSQCSAFKQLTKEQVISWIKANKRCWRCGRTHQAAQCNLRKPCNLCKCKHLRVLHDANSKPQTEGSCLVNTATETLYLERPRGCTRVLLKVVQVIIRHGDRSLETYAVMDDGSERTILLAAAAQKLGLQGEAEDLALRTIRQDVKVLRGKSVSFQIASASQPTRSFSIQGAFTAGRLGLAEHTYPLETLQRRYQHLRGLPLVAMDRVRPLLLIGADYPHLITPIEPVRLGPPGGPAALKTRLGWTLQGPVKVIAGQLSPPQCLLTVSSPAEDLFRSVEKLWKMDILPFQNEKLVTRSRQDQEAVQQLEAKTTREVVDGVARYATPLLRVKNMPHLRAPKEAVMAGLRSMERRLAKDPERAAAYVGEIKKLEEAGYAVKLDPELVDTTEESWYITHHLVEHNGKRRVVFNCSFQFQGKNLNEYLLPGPNLGPSLLGVLLRFREHAVAISGDIKSMFHQVRLLPKDKPLIRFIWREMRRNDPPEVYEWQVLPFGTTCSPCCATFALQKHVFDHSEPGEDVRVSLEKCFYVDNCLQSLSSIEEARHLVHKLRALLASGGFEIRQWASNKPAIISSLPKEAKSESSELWLSQDRADPQEPTLGLRWHCQSDMLGYKHRPVNYTDPTMRNIYRVLASQYDPLGYILPFTTRAKVLVQQLWDKKRDWDDPMLPEDLLQAWKAWEGELQELPLIALPRCYVTPDMDQLSVIRDLHIFCDASERAYGSVAYLRTEDSQKQVQVSFVMARSRVAPKRQHSMPRLELSAALTGAQLAKLLERELTVEVRQKILWTDSTTVLTWLQSEPCRFKVFVGTRVAEIQELTDLQSWRYVDPRSNPADDLTRGKSLRELAAPNRWRQGPPFLQQPPEAWPQRPNIDAMAEDVELRKAAICGLTVTDRSLNCPDPCQFNTLEDMVEATCKSLQGAASQDGPSAANFQEAEYLVLKTAQMDSFPEDYENLKAGKPVSPTSRLRSLAPEFDPSSRLIRVGGRLRQVEGLDPNMVHPIVLDQSHPVTKLLIRDYDDRLHHPGPERVFGEIRRKFWILRGREAIRHYQRSCPECRKWRAKPEIPRMADLPLARLRLMKPAFFSTGMDCFGPFAVKLGRRTEKKWGIIFKCLTTRSVHLDILTNMDTDSFLMALRRFIARRGKPSELISDQGTNFQGGEKELREAFATLSPMLQQQLAKQKISFRFNPPNAPHFGGAWEREIRSIKYALRVTLGAQTVTEEVLRTVLIEVEGILNSKPLGYVSSDVADVDPITPNSLLMGRPDSSLPQIVYPESELSSRRRWRHSQVLADQFWARFIKHYLPSLQARQKWMTEREDLKVDTVVMVIDPHLPRSLWAIGRVTEVRPGADGRVRVARVKVKDRIYTRPVSRLIELPLVPEDNASSSSS